MALERLQKIIARAGLTSRREAEQWITEGRVSVDGEIIRELGTKADPVHSRIKVNGKPIREGTDHLVYLLLHKPKECVTTLSDPQGRSTVKDFLGKIKERVYPVGRLDYHSEGMLLLTNDGEFANYIISPDSGIEKTYWIKVSGKPEETALEKLRVGIVLEGRRTKPAKIRRLPTPSKKQSENPWVEVVLKEGRQNQIRNMFTRIGHPVRKLRRVRIGPVKLGNLQPGSIRALRDSEVKRLLGKGSLSRAGKSG